MKRFSGDWADAALLACLSAFTLIFLVTAMRYAAEARVFPVAVSCLMLGLLALELISRQESDWSRSLRKRLNPASTSATEPYPRVRQLTAIMWVAAGAILFWVAGILLAVAVYVLASMRFRARRSYVASLAVSAGATLAIWLLFSVVLKIELYRGILGGGS
jgi:hypothetical protein